MKVTPQTNAGSYQLTITFEVGTDLDMATVLVENRVNMALSTLPQEVTQIGVTTTKESTNVVMFLYVIMAFIQMVSIK